MMISGTISGQAESAAFTYDNVGRVVTSNQTTNSVTAQRRFAYDRWGNRTGLWDALSAGNQIQSLSLQQSAGAPTNRISSVTTNGLTSNYTYDAAGNVTNDGAHSYTYDAENRVVSVDSGTTASYSYDHHNRRIKKVVAATLTHYVWQGNQVIAEHNGATGTETARYVYAGNRMIAKVEAGTMRFFISDRLSTRLVLDGNGYVIGRQSHLPYGEEIGVSGATTKRKFTSYDRDSETNTDYATNRGYSSVVGRFQQADPYKPSGGASVPQSWNRYSYTMNAPVNFVDPLGLFASAEVMNTSADVLPCTGGQIIIFGFSIGVCGSEGGPGSAPEPKPGQDPSGRPLCSEQGFGFNQGAGEFSAAELSAIAQTAVGEAGLQYYFDEIFAVIATVFNRRYINQHYLASGASRGPFNPGNTSIIGILQKGYAAHRRKAGEEKVKQAKGLNRGGQLLVTDYVCSQLVTAKNLVVDLAQMTFEELFSRAPFTYNYAVDFAHEDQVPDEVEKDAFNITRYGGNWFYHRPLPPVR